MPSSGNKMLKYVGYQGDEKVGKIVSAGPLCSPVSVKRNVIWLTNSFSTKKCKIKYITYFTSNLLLHVSAQLPSSGSFHKCRYNLQ